MQIGLTIAYGEKNAKTAYIGAILQIPLSLQRKAILQTFGAFPAKIGQKSLKIADCTSKIAPNFEMLIIASAVFDSTE